MDAKECKERLGQRARDIIAYGLSLDKYKPSKNEACCPFHKEKTPSFKWDTKRLCWHCFGCGETLDIYRYFTYFENMDFKEAINKVVELTGRMVGLSMQRQITKYKKPDIKVNELGPEAIQYMEKRKISTATLNDWRVKQRNWNGKECFVFQYFDDKDDLQFVSYREIKKEGFKGGCEKDSKPILWGIWHIDITKPVVITEGQPDAMAIWEAGYKNVVSVPMGSSNLTWIDTCWDWLQQVQEFELFGDNDEPGLKLIKELTIRLGKYRTKVINHKHKDANEILYYQGKDEILRLINEAIKRAPAGIINMSQVEYESIKGRQDEGIPTGFYGLDSVIEDLQPEQLTILVGRNGEGKSTLLSQVCCNCIDKKIPVFIFSGEMSTQRLLHWLYIQAIGRNEQYIEFVQTKYRKKADIRPFALEALKKWSGNLYFTYDKSASNIRKNISDLFEVMTIAKKRYGCRLFIIDNLMSALEDTADSINADQSNFVQQCVDFALAYQVHIILVVHPSKIKRIGETLEKEDISGSNNIPNKADNIISIERQYKEDRECDTKLRLLKNRENGSYCEVQLMFQEDTKRLLEIGNGDVIDVKYKWEQYLPNEDFYEIDGTPEGCPF